MLTRCPAYRLDCAAIAVLEEGPGVSRCSVLCRAYAERAGEENCEQGKELARRGIEPDERHGCIWIPVSDLPLYP